MPARPPIPPVLRQRLAHFRGRVGRKRGVPAAVLLADERSVRYLTGFTGEDAWLLVPTRGSASPVLLSDARFTEQLKRECPHLRPVLRVGPMAEAVAEVVKKKRLRTVGLADDEMTLAQHRRLGKEIGVGKLRAVETGLLAQRAVKTPDEVKLIAGAAAIQQEAFTATIADMRPGQTEEAIAARLEYEMRKRGAEGVSFPSIVAADGNAALPHYRPAGGKLRKNGSVLIDWGARYRGYCSDMTRVVFLGKPDRRLAEVYQVVLDAQMLAIEAIGPGVKLREVDKLARDYIKKHGYGKQFGHGLGHGIGLAIHEEPVLSFRAPEDGVLEPGHVVTVEPGVYLPGVGGVRIEDDVLVTDRGHRVLTHLPKTLDSAMLQVASSVGP